ncbi:MAG: phosphate regulon sensor histidine kinase PhoR [Gammaproteobacteria bacterium]
MPGRRLEEFWLFLAVAAIAVATGILTERLLLSLLLGLCGYLCWHLYHIDRLPDLLGGWKPRGPVPLAGMWRHVAGEIEALRNASRMHEQSLSRSLESFRSAVMALPDAVVILDQAGRVEWSNRAAASLLGIAGSRSQGRPFSDLVSDPLLEEYLAAGDFTRPLQFSAPGNRGKILSLQAAAIGTDPPRQLIVTNDISRQYHLDAARRDFVANVSHELRTPLTVIAGLLEQLDTGDTDAATRKRAIELMRKQAVRMRDLIADLLTLSRLETKEHVRRDEHVPVVELLPAIVEDAQALGESTGHVLHLDIRSPDGLLGNTGELRTAFANLVTNAIQHTPNRAEVRITWKHDAAGAHLSVSDTGEGIAPRHIPRLTERLYRVDASRSRDTGGTGLGLAIVKHVLERHDATLEIASQPGRGSAFTCHFPPERVSSGQPADT